MTCVTSVRVPGIRVRKPSFVRLAAFSAVDSLASATKERGLGEACQVALSAWARSWKICVSEA